MLVQREKKKLKELIGRSQLLFTALAHEFGHNLGLNAERGEGHSITDGDIMDFNAGESARQIRRFDWRTITEP